MIFFKSRPRCSGDRSLERDYYGRYVLCLTCGYVTYPDVGIETTRSLGEYLRTLRKLEVS